MLSSEKEFELQQTGLKNGEIKRSGFRKTAPQIIATIGFGMLILGVSAICAMPTIVLGSLYREGNLTEIPGVAHENLNETEIPLSRQQASWLGSIVFIAQPIGSVTSGFIQEIFGRKKCMMAVNIPQIIGWIILSFSTGTVQLFIASILMGLSVGFMEAPAMSYLGEVCEPKLRGTLSSFSETFLFFGILVEFLVGASFYWRYACAVSALIPAFTFLIIYFIPESPVWFIVKGRTSEAEKALMWLRGWVTKDEVQQELNDLIKSIQSQTAQQYVSVPTSECCVVKNTVKKKSLLSAEWDQVKLLKESRVYRPINLVAIFFFVGHCVTLLGMRPFLVNVFSELNLSLPPFTVLVLVGVFQAFGSLFSVILIHKIGKRKLAFISMTISCIGVILLALYIIFSLNYPWIPLTLFGFVFFGGGMGVLALPWVLLSEIFPLDARGISAGLAAASSYILAFIVTKTYLDLIWLMELPGVLILYFIIGVLGMIYLYYMLPETEGKTLIEIEELFKSKTNLKA